MYAGWLAAAQGLFRLQIAMSFESDKSDSYFSQADVAPQLYWSRQSVCSRKDRRRQSSGVFPCCFVFGRYSRRCLRPFFRHKRECLNSSTPQSAVAPKLLRTFFFKCFVNAREAAGRGATLVRRYLASSASVASAQKLSYICICMFVLLDSLEWFFCLCFVLLTL